MWVKNRVLFAKSAYARIRSQGTNWKDDPSWRLPLSDTARDIALGHLKEFIGSKKKVA